MGRGTDGRVWPAELVPRLMPHPDHPEDTEPRPGLTTGPPPAGSSDGLFPTRSIQSLRIRLGHGQAR